MTPSILSDRPNHLLYLTAVFRHRPKHLPYLNGRQARAFTVLTRIIPTDRPKHLTYIPAVFRQTGQITVFIYSIPTYRPKHSPYLSAEFRQTGRNTDRIYPTYSVRQAKHLPYSPAVLQRFAQIFTVLTRSIPTDKTEHLPEVFSQTGQNISRIYPQHSDRKAQTVTVFTRNSPADGPNIYLFTGSNPTDRPKHLSY